MTKLPEFAPEFLSCAYEREIQVPFSLIIIKGKLVVIDKEEHLPFSSSVRRYLAASFARFVTYVVEQIPFPKLADPEH